MVRHARAALLLGFTLITGIAEAQTPAIRYTVAWGAANDHWLTVDMHITNVRTPEVDVRIPYWRPGRYIVQNFAKNVVQVSAAAGSSELPVRKIDRNTWRVAGGGAREIQVRYRVWANQLDAGASYVGQGKLSLNPVTALLYVPGREAEPVSLSLAKPDAWEVATALDWDGSLGAFVADDYHELVDSPVLAGTNFRKHPFSVRGAQIELVVEGDWTYDADAFVDHHRRIVEAQFDLMQDVPFDRFVFLYQFVPTMMGHGVEHLKSTSIVLGPASMVPFPTDLSNPGFYGALLSVASHEFFHAWNVERIRPAAMTPTDYGREQYTSLMWAFEGTTDYYADVALLRAGLITEERFLGRLAQTVGDFDVDPGRKITSVAMSSFDSWAKDDGAAPDGTFYSYYTAGKAMGLVLDLEVRGRTNGRKSMDDVMRLLNERYGKTGIGVPEDGFLTALAEVTGTSFTDFFAAHIDGVEDVDWNAHLAHAGMRLVRTPDAAQPVRLGVEREGQRITGIAYNSPAFRAGLDEMDEIVAVNGSEIADPEADFLEGFVPGDQVELSVRRYGTIRQVQVTLDASLPLYAIERMPDASPTQVQIRNAWLSRSN